MAKKTISMRRDSHEESAAVIEEAQAVEQTEAEAILSEAQAEPLPAAVKKPSAGSTFAGAMKRGVILENPVLRLVLGTCPTLATTTAASNAIGMGIAATLVLICSNTVISLLRNIIPDKVRIPAYITIIASFVSIV